MTNDPQPGDRIIYAGRTGNHVAGIVAERAIGPLSGNPRYRVVDFASEMRDEEAGRWVDVFHVISIRPRD
jgi:hydrogenase maturation factor